MGTTMIMEVVTMFRDLEGWYPFVVRTLDLEGVVTSNTYFAICKEHAIKVAEALNQGHKAIECGMLN